MKTGYEFTGIHFVEEGTCSVLIIFFSFSFFNMQIRYRKKY